MTSFKRDIDRRRRAIREEYCPSIREYMTRAGIKHSAMYDPRNYTSSSVPPMAIFLIRCCRMEYKWSLYYSKTMAEKWLEDTNNRDTIEYLETIGGL